MKALAQQLDLPLDSEISNVQSSLGVDESIIMLHLKPIAKLGG